MTTVYAKVQMRRDTAANWAAANPVLAEGEVGYIIDTKAEKIGDGVTAWNDLLSRPSLEQLTDVQNAAQTAASDAQQRLTSTVAAQTATETARDETQTLRDQTYTYKQDVASAIVYQDLASIAEEKAINMVAGFVYDTRLDSDGGAWRERCHGLSWYQEPLNTATRGSRRDFPTVAVVIAESNKVTIFDGDDPSLPMWMVFNKSPSSSYSSGNFFIIAYPSFTGVCALNGKLAITDAQASDGGLRTVDFLSEELTSRQTGANYSGLFKGNVAQRNDGLGYALGTVDPIISKIVNDLAITVLPDAPVDPATGLQSPTIAVATNGGVSVIKHDESVVSKAYSSAICRSIALDGSVALIGGIGPDGYNNQWTWDYRSGAVEQFGGVTDPIPFVLGNTSVANPVTINDSRSAWGGFERLALLHENRANKVAGMAHYLTSTWISGWLPGAVKGAFLASTDQTSLVASGEIVTNGTFDADASGWTGSNATLSSVTGELQVLVTAAGLAYAYQAIATTPGRTYTAQVDFTNDAVAGNSFLYVGTTAGAGNLANVNMASALGHYKTTFVATGTTTYLSVSTSSSALAGDSFRVDNISVQLADDDRSAKGNGLIVHGTVPRAPVASGAELVGYGPFNSANYLEQPYNPDWNFGGDDFCIMGWAKSITQNTSTQTLVMISDGNYVLRLGRTTISGLAYPSSIYLQIYGANDTLNVGGGIPDTKFSVGQWCHVVLLRRNGVTEVYHNGKLAKTYATPYGAFVTAASNLRIGSGFTVSGYEMAMALWRIGATAPSAAQIAKIYRDERRLFQPGAQCTLYGTSDAVTALAHDPVTGLLHVGTSNGRSDFDGLLRVGNSQTPVAEAISASGGMILEG